MTPVTSARSMGHGGSNSMADARNGTNTTEEPIRAVAIRAFGRKDESLAIPKTAKAMSAFQNAELLLSANDGTNQGVANNKPRADTTTDVKRILNAQLSSLGWLSAIQSSRPRKEKAVGPVSR